MVRMEKEFVTWLKFMNASRLMLNHFFSLDETLALWERTLNWFLWAFVLNMLHKLFYSSFPFASCLLILTSHSHWFDCLRKSIYRKDLSGVSTYRTYLSLSFNEVLLEAFVTAGMPTLITMRIPYYSTAEFANKTIIDELIFFSKIFEFEEYLLWLFR